MVSWIQVLWRTTRLLCPAYTFSAMLLRSARCHRWYLRVVEAMSCLSGNRNDKSIVRGLSKLTSCANCGFCGAKRLNLICKLMDSLPVKAHGWQVVPGKDVTKARK